MTGGDAPPPPDDAFQPTVTPPAGTGDDAPAPHEAPTGEYDPSREETFVGGLSSLETSGDGAGPSTPGLGGYVLEKELARGGMGVVHLARDTALNRRVAVKMLLDRFDSDGAIAARFVEEAQITGQLQHPAIPPVHQVGTLDDGRPFLAMKLIQGTTLAQLLKQRQSVGDDLGRFVGVFEQVCQAVGYAHAHDVIHRDLKPSNVMVGAFGEVQVMDWGLAKVLGAGSPAEDLPVTEHEDPATVIETGRDGSSMTQAGTLLGTPAYMPPEQANGEIARTDRRADVFALGAIIGEILTGKPPYAADTAAKLHALAMTAQLEPAFERLDGCEADADLVALAKRCLSVERDDRPADAGVVATAVADHLAAAEERARQAELDRVRREAERKRRRVQIALGAAVVGLLIAAGVGVAIASLWREAASARDTAQSALAETQTARDDAEKARDAEEAARLDAEQAREKLARVEYGRTIQVALQRWREGNIKAARQLLEGTREGFRGWEYRYLYRLCHPEILAIEDKGPWMARYSPDGTRIAVGSFGTDSIGIFDAETGEEIRRLGDDGDSAAEGDLVPRLDNSVIAWSPDGERIASSGPLRMWNARTGEEVPEFFAREDLFARVIDWSPDGRWIVTSGKASIVWDAKTGEELHEFEFEGMVGSARFDNTSDRVLVVEMVRRDGGPGLVPILRIVDTKTWTVTRTLEDTTAGLQSPTFSPDGKWILASTVGGLGLWSVDDGSLVRTLEAPLGSMGAEFSPDGTKVVTGATKHVYVLDVETGATLRRHSTTMNTLWPSFSPDGTRILANDDGAVRVWDATLDPQLTRVPATGGTGRATDFSPNGRMLLTAQSDGLVQVWDTQSSTLATEFRVAANPNDPRTYLEAKFDATAERVLGVNRQLDVAELRDARGGTLIRSFPLGENGSGARLSPRGDRLITNNLKQMLTPRKDERGLPLYHVEMATKLWNVETGELLLMLDHDHALNLDCFSPDGSLFAIGEKGAAVLYSADTGEEVLRIERPTKEAIGTRFSPDGTRLLLTYQTGDRPAIAYERPEDVIDHLDVFDARTGEERFSISDSDNYMAGAKVSPDGSLILAGTNFDGSVLFVDAGTGAKALVLKGHTESPQTVDFNYDGSRILTVARGTLKLWDTATGTETMTFAVEEGVTDVRFSSDGTRILGLGSNGGVIWDSRPVGAALQAAGSPSGEAP